MENKIFNEDCLKTMNRDGMKGYVDLIITSPPYNISRRNGGLDGKTKRYDVYDDWLNGDEYISFIVKVFNGFDAVLKKDGCVLFNFSYSIENPLLPHKMIVEICRLTNFNIVDTIVWKKNVSMPHPASKNRLRRICEFVYVFVRDSEVETFYMNKSYKVGANNQKYYDVVDNFITAKNNDAPTDLNKATFSTEFVRKLIGFYARPNSIIYDPFIGTGTTAVASIIDGHRYIGSEISTEQCRYAENRIIPFLSQYRLF